MRWLTLLVWCLSLGASASEPPMLPVVPAPAAQSFGQGVFVFNADTRIERVADEWVEAQIVSVLQQGLPTPTAPQRKNVIEVFHEPGADMGAEEYALFCRPDTLLLVAATERGLYYAAQTVLQLIRATGGAIPCGEIHDRPRYAWRGFMLDESRHFFGKEKVKQYLDLMAGLKLNVFHWHLTDEPGWRIEIKKYPKLTQIGAVGNWHNPAAPAQYYTQDDIREIVAYAAERFITVVPEIDMPGHATAACRAYPELSGGGEGKWSGFTFHPAQEQTFQFLGDVLDEVCDLFPGPYIHIGGDEVHYGNQSWFTDPKIQQFIKDKGVGDEKGLEHYFLRRVAQMVAKRHRTLVGWDEMVDAGVPPSQAVVMWWRHDRRQQLLKALQGGYRVVLTPRRPLYGDFIQHGSHKVGRTWQGYNPIEDIVAFPDPLAPLMAGRADQVLGLQLSMWTERISTPERLDYMTFPRLAAVAQAAWSPVSVKDVGLFMQRLPYYLKELDRHGIYYFDPFAPERHAEPWSPEKEDVLQNG